MAVQLKVPGYFERSRRDEGRRVGRVVVQEAHDVSGLRGDHTGCTICTKCKSIAAVDLPHLMFELREECDRLGLTREEAQGTLRLSIGRWTTREEVDLAVDLLSKAVMD